MRVLVIGCGVSGLSCGVRLLEAGHAVSIRAREFPPYTTSDVAAAVWYPYLTAPRDRVLAWGARSYEVFLELAPDKRSGVTLRRAVEVLDAPSPDPWWRSAVEGFEHARPDGDEYRGALDLCDFGRHLMPHQLNMLLNQRPQIADQVAD